MIIKNDRLEPDPANPGNFILFGDFYDYDNNLIGSFGENGVSLFEWWAQQPASFHYRYVSQFYAIMAYYLINKEPVI